MKRYDVYTLNTANSATTRYAVSAKSKKRPVTDVVEATTRVQNIEDTLTEKLTTELTKYDKDAEIFVSSDFEVTSTTGATADEVIYELEYSMNARISISKQYLDIVAKIFAEVID